MKAIFKHFILFLFWIICIAKTKNIFAQDSIIESDTTDIAETAIENNNYFESFFADTNDIKNFNSEKAKQFRTDTIIRSENLLSPNIKNIEKYSQDEDFIYTEDVEKKRKTVGDYIAKSIERALKKIFGTSLFKLPYYLVQFLKYLLIAIFIIALLYFILKMRYKWIFAQANAEIDIDSIEHVDEIKSLNFKTPLNEALQQGNYRSAMRLRYFEALQYLEKNQIIAWNKYKTNHDYIYEIKHEPTQEQFKEIVKLYEWIWFGESEANVENYSQLDNWIKALNTVKEQQTNHA